MQTSTDNIAFWLEKLCCPVDQNPLSLQNGQWECATCGFQTVNAKVANRDITDFRALNQRQMRTLAFELPLAPLKRYEFAERSFQAVNQDFDHYSRSQVRQRFGTKLDKGIQYYCQQVLREFGENAAILDLGCGSGGNRRYLNSLGFRNVFCVDWAASGADILVDAHRLPLQSGIADLVISTAVFEHLYNPFIAAAEIARILKPGGYFVGGASFWEGWHGSSHCHLTPEGWNALFVNSGLEWLDFWTGWGIVPAALTHVLTPGHFRSFGYALQNGIETVYRLLIGERGVRRLQLRASGSYMVCARKKTGVL